MRHGSQAMQAAAVVPRGRAAVAGPVSVAGRCLGARAAAADRIALRAGGASTSGRICAPSCRRRSPEINRIVALDDLVRASDPPVSGPPPTDAAFLVWSQTSLATERLTSSVELHNAAGAMVSRFAMNLPDFTQPQPWSEHVVRLGNPRGGVAAVLRRAAAAARRHARSALPDGRRAGSVVVHSMLDYGNLSFISAQNPYVALMRSGTVAAGAAAARRRRVLRLRLEPPRALQLRRGRAAAYAKRRSAAPTRRARRSGPRSRADRIRSMRSC